MTDHENDEMMAKNFWKQNFEQESPPPLKTVETVETVGAQQGKTPQIVNLPKKAKVKVEHVLKAVQPYFEMLWSGKKNFELRKNDRDYQVGDILYLHEYDPSIRRFCGRYVARKITHIIDNKNEVAGQGLHPAWVLLFLGEIDDNKG